MDSCVGQEVSSHIACEIGLIVGMSGCAVIVETYLLGGGESSPDTATLRGGSLYLQYVI